MFSWVSRLALRAGRNRVCKRADKVYLMTYADKTRGSPSRCEPTLGSLAGSLYHDKERYVHRYSRLLRNALGQWRCMA